MAVGTGSEAPTQAPRGGSAAPRALASGALKVARRILTLREGSIVVVTVLVAIYFSTQTSAFATGGNFKTLLPYFAPFAILAAGQVFVMILGEIDLSIGAVYLFTPYMFYEVHNGGIPVIPSLILALMIAMVVGFINGVFVAVVGISSFVATLGALFTLEGMTLIISHAQPVPTPDAQVTTHAVTINKVVNGAHITLTQQVNHTSSFAKIFGAGTYSELIWALVIVVVLQIVLSLTRWGIYTVAVGGNKLGAAEAGISVRLITIRNFVLCSACAGLVGVLEAVRASSITPDPSGANEILLQAIAAAVIGGTLLAGGSGTVVGALIGALFLGILHDGLIIKGVNADYLSFYLGVAILLAMTINVYAQRVRRGSGLG